MDDLKSRLRQLSIKRPTPQLKDRIFAEFVEPMAWIPWWSRTIQIGWAFGLAAFMALSGYAVGANYASNQPAAQSSLTYEIHFVDRPEPSELFDMTTDGQEFLSGALSTSVEIIKEM